MVADSSAVVASFLKESGAERYEQAMRSAPKVHMSAVNAFECRIVLRSRSGPNEDLVAQFARLVRSLPIQIAAFDEKQAEIASDAYRRYGKGSGSPARLNMGDCAAYALAKSLDLPLLYKGNDFVHTDIVPAAL